MELTKPTPREMEPVREPLSDKRIGEYLAAIGNHEGKALLLAAMEPGRAYTYPQLDKLIAPKGKKIWSHSLPFDWCNDSLAPIGLVTKELIDPQSGIIGYEITEEGAILGKALAGHLLTFSESKPHLSLYQLSGQSSSTSPENRAPINRFRILKKIASLDKPIREIDVITYLKETYPDYETKKLDLIGTHLQTLADIGVITYKSRDSDTPYTFYSPVAVTPEGPPPVFRTYKTLTQQTLAILAEVTEPVSVHDVYAALLAKYPSYEASSERNLKTRLSGILAFSAREGYAKKEDFDMKTQSVISVTDEQKRLITEYVTILNKFTAGDPKFLAEGIKKATAIVKDGDRYIQLMQKAYDTSPNTQNVPKEETLSRMVQYLTENPSGTYKDIQTFLMAQYKQEMTTANIGLYAKDLIKEGKVKATKVKTRIHLSVKEKPQLNSVPITVYEMTYI